ncbi:MAG: ATP-dependent Clp protease proteolytic subunit, partial [Oscillospiraceae bacterium]|nr:ATP-dependent Clp protease proteolytic subunit [Oscillospiraceae bacterium]
PLAVAAKTSFIAPSAAMTIHPVRLSGTVIGVSQMFTYFQRTQDRILEFVVRNSRIRKEDFLRLMLETGELTGDIGSVLYGQEAVELGLIDRVGGLREALDCLHQQIEERKRKQGE